MIQNPFVNKKLKVKGLGKSRSTNISLNVGLNTRTNPKILKLKQYTKVEKQIKTLETGKKLINSKIENINFLLKNKTYKGVRHKLRYPVRGQRTHTNAKTKKKIKT